MDTGVGIADGIDRNVRAAFGQVTDRLRNPVCPLSVKTRNSADLPGGCQLLFRDIDGHDVRTQGGRNHDRGQAHTAAAVHNDPLIRGHPALVNDRSK